MTISFACSAGPITSPRFQNLIRLWHLDRVTRTLSRQSAASSGAPNQDFIHGVSLQLGDGATASPSHGSTKHLWVRLGNECSEDSIFVLALEHLVLKTGAAAPTAGRALAAERLVLHKHDKIPVLFCQGVPH